MRALDGLAGERVVTFDVLVAVRQAILMARTGGFGILLVILAGNSIVFPGNKKGISATG